MSLLMRLNLLGNFDKVGPFQVNNDHTNWDKLWRRFPGKNYMKVVRKELLSLLLLIFHSVTQIFII